MKLHLSFLALALPLLSPSPATACSCGFQSTELLVPADGDIDVPVNTRIWVGDGIAGGYGWDDALRLVDESGDPVDVTETSLRGGLAWITILSPEQPLEAGATYTIWVQDGWELGSFAVGSATDSEPPEIPVEWERDGYSSTPDPSSTCGSANFVSITVEPTGVAYVVDVADQDPLDVERLDGLVDDLATDGRLYAGRGPCSGSWPGAAPGATTSIRWAAFDQAGNFSGWSDDVWITVPPVGCNCVAVGGQRDAADGWLLLVLFGLTLPRRLRSGAARSA
jgi:hypothetical protein